MGVGAPTRARAISLWSLAGIVIVYLAIIKGVGYAVGSISDASDIYTVRNVVLLMWLPLGAALIFTFTVATCLGWLRPVLRDSRPVRKWVWTVPMVFVVCIAVAINYGALADKSISYVLVLLVATQIVGWGEEGMFRGIGVVALRKHGLTEGKVAVWSSILFGVVHISNAIGGEVSKALPQALFVSFAGYFFYLTRRVSRGNVVNSVVHGLFDFSIISATGIASDQGSYLGTLAAVLAYLVVGVVLFIRRRHIEPAEASTEPAY